MCSCAGTWTYCAAAIPLADEILASELLMTVLYLRSRHDQGKPGLLEVGHLVKLGRIRGRKLWLNYTQGKLFKESNLGSSHNQSSEQYHKSKTNRFTHLGRW